MLDRLVATGLALGLTFLATLPTLSIVLSQLARPKSRTRVYHDKDGASTEDLTSTFSAKYATGCLLTFSLLGFAGSIVLAILIQHQRQSKIADVEQWIRTAQWGLLLLQALDVANIRNSVQRYNLGLYSALSSLLVLAVAFYNDLFMLTGEYHAKNSPKVQLGLKTTLVVLALLNIVSSMNISRRPQVFVNDTPVDGQYTVSAIKRYTYSWVSPLLRTAYKRGRLEFADLWVMDHATRTTDLVDQWENLTGPKALGRKLIYCYRWSFLTQQSWTLVQAVLSFAPQYIILHFLKALEKYDPENKLDPNVWIWVITLAIGLASASWLEQWAFWVSWSRLAVPIRAQLSALIFRKAMRRKDVTEAIQDTLLNLEDKTRKSKLASPGARSTTNLIGVDCKRISDFCAMNNMLSGSAFKFIVAMIFLSRILGGKPLFCGVAVVPVLFAINFFLARGCHRANSRLMKLRDEKLAVATEALHGIRQIKFSAQESEWQEKLGKLRERELEQIWTLYKFVTGMLFCYIFTPIAVAATSLSVFSYINGGLDPATAFTALAVFKNLETALAIVPDSFSRMLQARESTKRIRKFLDSPELVPCTKDATSISFKNASIAWPHEENDNTSGSRFVLRNVNLNFPQGELSVVGGQTGSGKSLLLAAILGEVEILAGVVTIPHGPSFETRRDDLANHENWIIPSSLAFVNQIPWVENASIRENIIFGLPFDETRYQKVVRACTLNTDLKMLPDGEWTDIGAKGINLSGGQKWRITLARALYSRAGILVLDDIFSAVDSHVGRFIFEEALTGELGAGRTRILVTHHLELVRSKANYVVELGNGTVTHADLCQTSNDFGSVANVVKEQKQTATVDDRSTAVNFENSDSEIFEVSKKFDAQFKAKKFVEEEQREMGHVKFAYYLEYMKNSGGLYFWIPALFIFLLRESANIGQSWWLKHWTGQQKSSIKESTLGIPSTYNFQTHFTPSLAPVTERNISSKDDLFFYLGIYVGLSVWLALLGTLQFGYIYSGSVRASRNLFDKLSETVLRAPLRWLDTIPTGRILTRFTSDFETVDTSLAWNGSQFGVACCSILGVIVAAIIVSPWAILVATIIIVVSAYCCLRYLPGAREVKRLESKMKSPIIEIFESSLLGLTTIRAFAKVPAYVKRMELQIDKQTACSWLICLTNRWIGIRTALIGNLFTIAVAIFVVIFPRSISLAAFALNFASQYGTNVSTLVRQYTNMELDMNATERILEYTTIPTETSEGVDPPAAWPYEGRLEFNDLVVAYAPDLPPVLKGLSFSVSSRERVGVVGRTGAGKSSLTLALFRFLNAREGLIHIDGLDISKMKLQQLRSRIAIIPQDPTLFSGTIRTNLDSLGEHSDLELIDALERVHLVTAAEFVVTPPSVFEENASSLPTGSSACEVGNKNIFASLSSPITAGGLNLSQGQRQLLCLARAIVLRPKIMILDEATSAVDMATDALIQRSIREEFGDSTLLVIAHRLNTIADFDKILVMEDGKAIEFGTPKELVQLRDGAFRGMVDNSGDSKSILQTILGSQYLFFKKITERAVNS